MKLQVAYLGSSNLFGRVVTTFLKQFPSIKRLNIYGCTDTVDISEDLQQTCKVHQYAGKEQLPAALENVDIVVIGDEIDSVEPSRECILNISSKIFDYAFVTASVAPKAMVVVSAKPLNLMVPLLGHVLQDLGCFDGRKLLGVTSEETLRSNPLLAELAGLEEAVLPVVGGASPQTRVPLFSQAKPALQLKEEDKHKLINDIKSFDLIFPKEEIAAERAYATIKLLRSLIRGLEEETVTEMALTKTSLVADTSYFSLPVELGRGGVERAFGLPPLQGLEEELLEYAVVNLNHDLTRAYDIFRGLRPGLESPRQQDPGKRPIVEGQERGGMSTFPKGIVGKHRSEELRAPNQDGSPPTENEAKNGSHLADKPIFTGPRTMKLHEATMKDQIGLPIDVNAKREEMYAFNHCLDVENEPAKQVAVDALPIDSLNNTQEKVQTENLRENQIQHNPEYNGLPQSEKVKSPVPKSSRNTKQSNIMSEQFEEKRFKNLELKNEKTLNNNLGSNILKNDFSISGKINEKIVNKKKDLNMIIINKHQIKESLRNPNIQELVSCTDEPKIQSRKEVTGVDIVQDSSRKEKEVQIPLKSLDIPSHQDATQNSTIVHNSQQSNSTPESSKPSFEPCLHDKDDTIIKESESIQKNALGDNEVNYNNEVEDQEKLENKMEPAPLDQTKLSVPCPIDCQLEWENKANNNLTFTEYSILADQGFTSQVFRKNSGFHTPKKQIKNKYNVQKSEMNVNNESGKLSKGETKKKKTGNVKEILRDNKSHFKEVNIKKIKGNKNPRENNVGNKQATVLYQSPTDVVYRGNIKKNNKGKEPKFKMANKYADVPIKKTQQHKLRKSPKTKPLKMNDTIEKHGAIMHGKDTSNTKGKKCSPNHFGNLKTEKNEQHHYNRCTQKTERELGNSKEGQDNDSFEGLNKRTVTEKNSKHVNVFSGRNGYKSNDEVPKRDIIFEPNAKVNGKSENVSQDDRNLKTISKPIVSKCENSNTKGSNKNYQNELMKIPQNEDKPIKTTVISFVNISKTESLNKENRQGSFQRDDKLKNNVAPFPNQKGSNNKTSENINRFIKEEACEQGEGTEKYVYHPFKLENKSNAKESEEFFDSKSTLAANIKETPNQEASLQRKSVNTTKKYDDQKLLNQSNSEKLFSKPNNQNITRNSNLIKSKSKNITNSSKSSNSLLKNKEENKVVNPTLPKGFPNITAPPDKLNSQSMTKTNKPKTSKSKLNIKNDEASNEKNELLFEKSILGKELALNLGIKQSFIKNKLMRKEKPMKKKRKAILNVRQNPNILSRDSKGKSTAKKGKKTGESRKVNSRRILPSSISNDCLSKKKTQVEINKRGIITSAQMKYGSTKSDPESLIEEKGVSNESSKHEVKVNKVKMEDQIHQGSGYNMISNIIMEETNDADGIRQNKPPSEQTIKSINNVLESLNKNAINPFTITTDQLKTSRISSPKEKTQENIKIKALKENSISVSTNKIENSFTRQNLPTTKTNNLSDNSTKSLSFRIPKKAKAVKPIKGYTIIKKGEVIPMIKQDFNAEGCKAKIYEQSHKLKATNEPKIVNDGNLIKEKVHPHAIVTGEHIIQKTKSALPLEAMTSDRIHLKSGGQNRGKILTSQSAHNLSLNSLDINNEKANQTVNKSNIFKMNQPKKALEHNEHVKSNSLKIKDKNDPKENNSKSGTNDSKLKVLDCIVQSRKHNSLKASTSVINNRDMMTTCDNENISSVRSEKSQKIQSSKSNLIFGPLGKSKRHENNESTVETMKRKIIENSPLPNNVGKSRNLELKSQFINGANYIKTNSAHTIHNISKNNSLNKLRESPRKMKSEIFYKKEQMEVPMKEKQIKTNNHENGKNQANTKLTGTHKIINKDKSTLETERNFNYKKTHEPNSNTTKTKFLKPVNSLPTTNINNLFSKFLNKSMKKRASDSRIALDPWNNIKTDESDNKHFSPRREQPAPLNANLKYYIKDLAAMDKNLVVKKDIPQAIQQHKTNYLRWSTKALKASHGIKETNSEENIPNVKGMNTLVVPLRNPFSVGQIKITSALFKEYMNKNRSFNIDNSKASQKRNFISPGLSKETPKNTNKKQNTLNYDKTLDSSQNVKKNRLLTKEKNKNVKVPEKLNSQNEKLFAANINQLHKAKSVKEKDNDVRPKSVLSGNMNDSYNPFIGNKIKKSIENPTPEVPPNPSRSARFDITMKPVYTPSARNFLDLTPTKLFSPYSQKEAPIKKIHMLKAFKREDKTKKIQPPQESATHKDLENYNNRQKKYSTKAVLSKAPQSLDRERPMFHPSQAVRKLKEEKSSILTNPKTESLGHFRNHLQRLFNMFQSVISNETKH